MELCICAIIDKAGKKQYGAFRVRTRISMTNKDGGILLHEPELDVEKEKLEELSHIIRVRLAEDYGTIAIYTKKPCEFYIVNCRPGNEHLRAYPNLLQVWKCEDLDLEEIAIVHKHLIQQVNWADLSSS